MKRYIIFAIIGCTFFCTSCISTRYSNTDSMATLYYLNEESSKNLSELAKSYKETLGIMLKAGDVKPGLCADYGVVLAKQNKPAEANKWFNRETTLYPSSALYVYRLKQSLIPEFADDTNAYAIAKAKEATKKASNTVSIDSLTTAPRPEMSNSEKHKALRERNKAIKAKEKAKRKPIKKDEPATKLQEEPKTKKK